MIDEKGRLFGKINLIDLLVIIVLIAVVAIVIVKFVLPSDDGGTAQEVTLVLFSDETPEYVVSQLEAGSTVYDSAAGVDIGTLVSWETGDSNSVATNSYGDIVTFARDGFHSVTLTVKCSGVIGPHGVTVGGVLYGIGHSMTVYAGDCKIFLRVNDILTP